jgi:hypothetical protein
MTSIEKLGCRQAGHLSSLTLFAFIAALELVDSDDSLFDVAASWSLSPVDLFSALVLLNHGDDQAIGAVVRGAPLSAVASAIFGDLAAHAAPSGPQTTAPGLQLVV